MTLLDLNSQSFHRKFDGVLDRIDLDFKERDSDATKMSKAFDVLGYGKIDEYIDDEDVEEDSNTEDESDESSDESSCSSQSAGSSSKQLSKLPKNLVPLPGWAKAKRRKHRPIKRVDRE